MPIILYGVRGYTVPTGGGTFFCPDCIEDSSYGKKLSFTAVHLYFIPIIPFRFQSYVECRTCWGTFKPSVLEWNPTTDPAFHSAKRQAIVQTMTLMMMADGEMDESEVRVVQEIAQELTGQPLSREELLGEVAKHEAGVDLLRSLEGVRAGLNQRGREGVLRAAIRVAMADEVLTDEETQLLHEVSRVLFIAPERAAVIWNEVAGTPG